MFKVVYKDLNGSTNSLPPFDKWFTGNGPCSHKPALFETREEAEKFVADAVKPAFIDVDAPQHIIDSIDVVPDEVAACQ